MSISDVSYNRQRERILDRIYSCRIWLNYSDRSEIFAKYDLCHDIRNTIKVYQKKLVDLRYAYYQGMSQ